MSATGQGQARDKWQSQDSLVQVRGPPLLPPCLGSVSLSALVTAVWRTGHGLPRVLASLSRPTGMALGLERTVTNARWHVGEAHGVFSLWLSGPECGSLLITFREVSPPCVVQSHYPRPVTAKTLGTGEAAPGPRTVHSGGPSSLPPDTHVSPPFLPLLG